MLVGDEGLQFAENEAGHLLRLVVGFWEGRSLLDQAVTKVDYLRSALQKLEASGYAIVEETVNELNNIQKMLDEDWGGEPFVQRYKSCHEMCMRKLLSSATSPRMLAGVGLGGVGALKLGIVCFHPGFLMPLLPSLSSHSHKLLHHLCLPKYLSETLSGMSFAGGGRLMLSQVGQVGQQVDEWFRLHKRRLQITRKVDSLDWMVTRG